MTTDTLTFVLTGKNIGELAAKALAFAEDAQQGVKVGKTTATTTKTKKTAAAAPVAEEIDEIEEPTDELTGDEEGIEMGASDEDEGFDDIEEEEIEEAPKKTAKAKTAKVTEKDVNAAALAHAKANTRPKTLALLKKHFKVGSISELKPDQYAKAVQVLKA